MLEDSSNWAENGMLLLKRFFPPLLSLVLKIQHPRTILVNTSLLLNWFSTQIYSEIDTLLHDVIERRKKEDQVSSLIGKLAAVKENMCREAARKLMKLKEAQESARSQDIMIFDYKKKLKETFGSLKGFTQLYETVKNERNKFNSLIHSSVKVGISRACDYR